ncbi:MAG TPA: GNAT family N-acetyltransferase [Spirochaetia bacterium]|nr:GNAT family N-acetyltransferase [Spirochaetia bacterium]
MPEITKELILTAGPTISYKEIEYVTNAAIYGWNNHHSDYIKQFEKAFADYIGAKYAMATSSCTGALHLALLAMGVGPGDEVIVPEITWIATVSAVKYVGAIPIFVDIQSDTWVMDPDSAAKAVTSRTKAIIPVHLYGHPVDMDPLLGLAEKFGIGILEDAAPAIGAEYKGKKLGSFGNVAAFSFQGAKSFVTGEGGMLVTNDETLLNRARFLGDHGRDPNGFLSSIEIGYKYKMSNIQAALGLAQIERADEIIAKKRQVFGWYRERLADIKDIALNVERPWAKNLFWMTSLVLGKSLSVTCKDFMRALKDRNIDTRSFFLPISSFPMFKARTVSNPVAYDLPYRGVNLPSGHERTEEEIDYVCAHIRDILGAENSTHKPQTFGWLSFRDRIFRVLQEFKTAAKENIDDYCVFLKVNNVVRGRLRPLTVESIQSVDEIRMLMEWRQATQEWFPSQFNVTYDGTKNWLENQVVGEKERILFFLESHDGLPVGHVGLYRFDFKKKSCELDNIIRGNSKLPGAMRIGCSALIDWAFDRLYVESIFLRVFSDNSRAIRLYNSLGFREILRVPLMKVQEGSVTRWLDVIGRPYQEVERYFVTMKLAKGDWIIK